MKIKTIDANFLEWFDKANGNSYCAGTVTINYNMKDEKTLVCPFQYGYGDFYTQAAMERIREAKLAKEDDRPLWRFCDDHDIILRAGIERGCLKRDLKAIAA